MSLFTHTQNYIKYHVMPLLKYMNSTFIIANFKAVMPLLDVITLRRLIIGSMIVHSVMPCLAILLESVSTPVHGDITACCV